MWKSITSLFNRYYWEHPDAGPVPEEGWLAEAIARAIEQPKPMKGLGYLEILDEEDNLVDTLVFHNARQYNLYISQTKQYKVKIYMYDPGVFGINNEGTGSAKSVYDRS